MKRDHWSRFLVGARRHRGARLGDLFTSRGDSRRGLGSWRHRTRMAALPFAGASRSALRTDLEPILYPENPSLLGEHLRKWRLDHGLTHRDLAERLKINRSHVWLLEGDRHRPTAWLLRRIVNLLGFDPSPVPNGLPAWLQTARRRLGLTQAALAARLGLDRSTVQKAEQGRGGRRRRTTAILREFVRSVTEGAGLDELN